MPADIFRLGRKGAERRDAFFICVSRGQSTGRHDFIKGEGVFSRTHIFVTSLVTNCLLTGKKAEKQLTRKRRGVILSGHLMYQLED